MKRTVDKSDFIQAFEDFDRKDNFSDDGLEKLFDYLEEYEEETGEEIELDVIAICCDYDEYESIADFNREYGKDCESLDEIRDYTTVIEIEEYERERNEDEREDGEEDDITDWKFIIQCF